MFFRGGIHGSFPPLPTSTPTCALAWLRPPAGLPAATLLAALLVGEPHPGPAKHLLGLLALAGRNYPLIAL